MRIIKVRQPMQISLIYQRPLEFNSDRSYIVPDSYVYTGLFQDKLQSDHSYSPLTKLAPDADLNGKHILTFRYGGIGDALFITTALRLLKQKYPQCKITFGVNETFHYLLQDDAYELVKTPIPFDLAKQADKVILFQEVIEHNYRAEVIDAYTLCCENVGVEYNGLLPKVNYGDDELKRVQSYLRMFQNYDLVTFQILSTTLLRNVPFKIATEIIAKLPDNYKVILTCSQDQLELMEAYLKAFPEEYKKKVLLFSKTFKQISEVAALVKLSKFVIGCDSSLLHIAGALQKPMIGLFGAFHSSLRLKHYKKAIGIDVISKCEFGRGEYTRCFEYGGEPCSLAKKVYNMTASPCMELIDVSEVIEAVKDIEKLP